VGLAFILFFGHDRRVPIPFGPFLCVAGWIALMWGETLTRYYLQFARISV
jgi:leader peptidase (prepilin peptidase)/N-methyltransferase